MIMQVRRFIQMGGNHHLKPITPQFVCKLDSDLMGLLRCNFTGSKGLIGVIGNNAAGFPVLPFYILHLLPCRSRFTVDSAYKLPGIRLFIFANVLEDRIQIIRLFALICLVFILDIPQDMAYVAFNGPDFCGCQ